MGIHDTDTGQDQQAESPTRSLSWPTRRRLVGMRHVAACLLVGLGALLASAGLGGVSGAPSPVIHDEFSYLLAADTFAHGRLTNKTVPAWQHFETFHVLQQPSYSSKYPPGQGLSLAVGQVALGLPIAGAWLSCALAAAASAWMLLALMPLRWAVFGGALAALQLGFASDMDQSYLGGGTSWLGSALMLGALLRLHRRVSVGHSMLLGLGVSLLAISRPWEGLLASLPAAVMVLAFTGRRCKEGRVRELIPTLLPCLGVLVLCGGLLAAHSQAVTGDALSFPHSVYAEQYDFVPPFRMGSLGEVPDYRHGVMRRLYENWALKKHDISRTPQGAFLLTWEMLKFAWTELFGLGLGWPLLALALVIRRPWVRYSLVATSILLAASFLTSATYARYLAPGIAPVLLLCLLSLRGLTRWRRLPIFLRRAVPTLALVGCLLAAGQRASEHVARCAAPNRMSPRQGMAADLRSRGGKHLVIVQDMGTLDPFEDWVWNGAEFSEEEILWARSISQEADMALIAAYPDRTLWQVALPQHGTRP